MRILGARIFLSFLAGKLSRFKQLLLTELRSFGGKILIWQKNLQVCDLSSRVFITKIAESNSVHYWSRWKFDLVTQLNDQKNKRRCKINASTARFWTNKWKSFFNKVRFTLLNLLFHANSKQFWLYNFLQLAHWNDVLWQIIVILTLTFFLKNVNIRRNHLILTDLVFNVYQSNFQWKNFLIFSEYFPTLIKPKAHSSHN